MADDDRCPTCNRPRDLVPIRQWGETESIREVPARRCCGTVWSPPTDNDEHEHSPEPAKRRRPGLPWRGRALGRALFCAAMLAMAAAAIVGPGEPGYAFAFLGCAVLFYALT